MALMKAPHRFLTTPHHRRRLALWTLAILSWIAAVLFGGKEIAHRHMLQRCGRISLERLMRRTIYLLIIRAAELTGRRPRQRLSYYKHGRDLRPRHFLRSLLGAELRRALRPKGLAARIAALINVLRNLDAHAERLAARMKRGLTRLWALAAASASAIVIMGPPTLRRARADTS